MQNQRKALSYKPVGQFVLTQIGVYLALSICSNNLSHFFSFRFTGTNIISLPLQLFFRVHPIQVAKVIILSNLLSILLLLLASLLLWLVIVSILHTLFYQLSSLSCNLYTRSLTGPEAISMQLQTDSWPARCAKTKPNRLGHWAHPAMPTIEESGWS